jgi:hypothetical protein
MQYYAQAPWITTPYMAWLAVRVHEDGDALSVEAGL